MMVAGIGALLSGCGFVMPEPREPWRGEAEAACMRSGIIQPSAYIRQTKPIDGPGSCGADLPLKVAAFQNDTSALAYASAGGGFPTASGPSLALPMTVLKPEATLTCPMVAWTDDWVALSVQPAALAWFGVGVKEIRTAGSYACRRRNHQRNARLSEHAFGNAIDVMSFVLADERIVTVIKGWRGSEQEQSFLRDVIHGACERFSTVLGPGADALHYDHFHLDLARHDARGQKRVCKPRVEAPQRPLPGHFAQHMPPAHAMAPALQNQPAPLAALNAPRPPSTMPQAPMPAANRSVFAEPQEVQEIEPNFDASEFDLTGSIKPLPERRAAPPRASRPQSLPAPTTSMR